MKLLPLEGSDGGKKDMKSQALTFLFKSTAYNIDKNKL